MDGRGTVVHAMFCTCTCILFLLPFPQVKKPSLLKKYDEEIEGEKRHSFALGELLVIVWGEEGEEGVDGGGELGYKTVSETGHNMCVTSWLPDMLYVLQWILAYLGLDYLVACQQQFFFYWSTCTISVQDSRHKGWLHVYDSCREQNLALWVNPRRENMLLQWRVCKAL